jgi:hypothetical protein
MSSVRKLNLEEYKEIGTEMKFLRERLSQLDIKVSSGIGKSKREAAPLRNITKQIDQCRGDLECLMYAQYSGQEGCNTDVFYGPCQLPSDLRHPGMQAIR